MHNGYAIEINGLSKTFGKGDSAVLAVDNLSLGIPRGQVYGILGPNGAGKTTTIKMICGMLRPDSGTVHLAGHPLVARRTKANRLATRALGICPQELVLWDGLTLMEQLVFMGRVYDLPKSVAMERAQGLLDVMGLTEKKNKLGGTLSGGMKRRVNLILGLMHDPEILILDEPQAGLDPQSRVLIRDYITGLSKLKTVLITTHDMEEADKVCDRVAIIDHGGILVENTPAHLKGSLFKGELVEVELDSEMPLTQDLLDSWRGEYGLISCNGNALRFNSDKPVALIEALQTQMDLCGLNVHDIKIRKGSLEDVFIELTGRGLRE